MLANGDLRFDPTPLRGVDGDVWTDDAWAARLGREIGLARERAVLGRIAESPKAPQLRRRRRLRGQAAVRAARRKPALERGAERRVRRFLHCAVCGRNVYGDDGNCHEGMHLRVVLGWEIVCCADHGEVTVEIGFRGARFLEKPPEDAP